MRSWWAIAIITCWCRWIGPITHLLGYDDAIIASLSLSNTKFKETLLILIWSCDQEGMLGHLSVIILGSSWALWKGSCCHSTLNSISKHLL